MLKVDNKMEELFLSDSVPKNLTIDVEGELDTSLIPEVNFYTGDIYGNKETTPYAYGSAASGDVLVILRTNISNPDSYDLGAFQNLKFKKYKKYIYVSYTVRIVPDPNTGYYPNIVKGSLSYYHTDGYSYSISIPISANELLGSGKELGFFLDSNVVKSLREIKLVSSGNIDRTQGFKLYSSKIQIRLTDSNEEQPSYVKSVSADDIDIDGYINGDFSITNSNLIQESFSLTESLCSQDNLKFGLCESAHCEFEVVGRNDKFIGKTIRPYINIAGEPKQNRIPLGKFKISEAKKNNTQDIIKKSITAYDNMSILEQNVGDWLTKYMWIWDTANKVHTGGSSFNRFGVEYARQLFPTLSNLMKQLNILTDDDFTFSFNVGDVDVEPANYNYGYNYLWGDFGDNPHGKGTIGILLAFTGSASFSEDKLLKVTLTPYGNMTDEELFGKFAFSDMADYWGKNYHGFPSCASVFVILHNEDGTDTKVLADSGDYIYISTKVTGYEVYYSAGIASINPGDDIMAAGFSNRMLTTHVNAKIYEVPDILSGLVNAHLRLVYYNYGTQELGSFDSSISGRDVLRSLLEVNGCFFHMNRYGKPEIIYASKAGLYPSEKLYPREDLYPRGMNGPLLSMSRYISMECDDYVVENYGKIQIKTQSRVKNGESICSYEYIGNPDGKNTYIIEDNIFYCAEGTVYEYGSQPEVDEMLKNLFDKISNLTYTPHTTKLRGLPFMECGDRVNLITKTGGIESFIFRRTLKGIHALMDTYEASGDEYNEALNTFDYKIYTPT